MVISNMQRLLDALQKWWPVHEGLPIFMRGVAAAMVLLLVTPTSLEATADRYQYPLGDISQAQLLERHEMFKRNFDAYEVTAVIDG